MTTIVYDGETLAADKLNTIAGQYTVDSGNKIHIMTGRVWDPVRSGFIVAIGTAGLVSASTSVVQQLKERVLLADAIATLPTIGNADAAWIFVYQCGGALVSTWGVVDGYSETFYTKDECAEFMPAIGSGSRSVQTLKQIGVGEAVQAVMLVSRIGLDANTGGGVDVWRLGMNRVAEVYGSDPSRSCHSVRVATRNMTIHNDDDIYGSRHCPPAESAQHAAFSLSHTAYNLQSIGNVIPTALPGSNRSRIRAPLDETNKRFMKNQLIEDLVKASGRSLSDIKLNSKPQDYCDLLKLLGYSVKDWEEESGPTSIDCYEVMLDAHVAAMAIDDIDRTGVLSGTSEITSCGPFSRTRDVGGLPEELIPLYMKALEHDVSYAVTVTKEDGACPVFSVSVTERSFGNHCERVAEAGTDIIYEISLGEWTLEFRTCSVTLTRIIKEGEESDGLASFILFEIDWKLWWTRYDFAYDDAARVFTLHKLHRAMGSSGEYDNFRPFLSFAIIATNWIFSYRNLKELVHDTDSDVIRSFYDGTYIDTVEDDIDTSNGKLYHDPAMENYIDFRRMLAGSGLRQNSGDLVAVDDSLDFSFKINKLVELFDQYYPKK